MFGKLSSGLFALFLLLCWGASSSAQSTATGEIRGTISDSTGAVIPKASVSVLNVDTGAQKVFTTNNDGLYDTVSTPNGRYKVTIAAPGFEKLVLGPITLDLGTITLNGRLKVGSESQEVVVTSDTAALLRTESGEQSTTLDEKTMQQLPQVGADWANFTILLPGSAGASSTGNSPNQPRSLSIAERQHAVQRQFPVRRRFSHQSPQRRCGDRYLRHSFGGRN